MKHKWHKEIKAWADGIEVEWKSLITEYQWVEVGDGNPMWHRHDVEFRIKPQPKEPQYLYAWLDKGDENIQWTYDKPTSIKEDDLYKYIGKIKLED